MNIDGLVRIRAFAVVWDRLRGLVEFQLSDHDLLQRNSPAEKPTPLISTRKS